MNPFSQLPAVKKGFKIGAASNFFGPSYFVTALLFRKIEKILEDSLDLISSPSLKIQIIVGKVYLRCKGKTLLGDVNKLFVFKSLQQCFAFTP